MDRKAYIIATLFLLALTWGPFAVSQQDRVPLQMMFREFKEAKSEQMRVILAEDLIQNDDPAVTSTLSSYINSPDRNLRMTSAYVLAARDMGQGLSVLMAEVDDMSERPAREDRIRSDGSPDNEGQRNQDRYLAVELLRRLGDPRVVRPLMKYMDDPDIDYIVVLALGAIGDERVISPLKLKMSKAGREDYREYVFTAAALADLGVEEGHAGLQKYLDSDDIPWVYRRYAIELAADLKDIAYTGRFLELLQDSQPQIRIAAANAMVTLRAKQTIGAIGNQMVKETRDVAEDEVDVYEALRQAIISLRKLKV